MQNAFLNKSISVIFFRQFLFCICFLQKRELRSMCELNLEFWDEAVV